MSRRPLGPHRLEVLPDDENPGELVLVLCLRGDDERSRPVRLATLDVDDATELAARLILEAKRAGHPDPVAMTRHHYREAR